MIRVGEYKWSRWVSTNDAGGWVQMIASGWVQIMRVGKYKWSRWVSTNDADGWVQMMHTGEVQMIRVGENKWWGWTSTDSGVRVESKMAEQVKKVYCCIRQKLISLSLSCTVTVVWFFGIFFHGVGLEFPMAKLSDRHNYVNCLKRLSWSISSQTLSNLLKA